MKKLSCNNFIIKASEKHNDKYDYSSVKYINNKTKVCIICPSHGEFLQTPNAHLNGQGCPMCAIINSHKMITMSNDDFILKSVNLYGSTYDYSRVKYINNHTKVCIICPIHGEFWQKPNDHLSGHQCPKCGHENAGIKRRNPQDTFIEQCIIKNGNKYDYSKVNYINNKTKICIICQKHGEFFQIPSDHLEGHGCPKCNRSHMEDEIKDMLEKNNLSYIEQYKSQWLGLQSLDFYLPDYKIAIECQGEQHFKPIKCFGGIDKLNSIINRDNKKKVKCSEQGIKILYYSNLKIEYPYKVFTDKNNLIKEITYNYGKEEY